MGIQTFQNKVLQSIVNAPWYIHNSDIYHDLGISEETEEIKQFTTKHESRLHRHTNLELKQLLRTEHVNMSPSGIASNLSVI